jgi:hypothetical protein
MNTIGAFSGYSSRDIGIDKRFYQETLGLDVSDDMGGLQLSLPNGQRVFIYPKDDHQPATFTVLNLVVDEINAAIDELLGKGVVFERYAGLPAEQDARGVLRGKDAGMGPNIAWFKDPSENILALVEN